MFRLNLKFLTLAVDRRRALARGAALLAGLVVLLLGAGDGLDRTLRIVRDEVRAHPASGEIVIVEMDARSLARIDRWPWPRRHHAALIDRLHAAGARSIAFDVDFSTLSNPREDAALASALRRAGGGVILPVLRQRESSQSFRYVENMPAAPFRDDAFLASVNISPGPDGYIRQMPLGLDIGGAPRPSLAAMVAESQAGVDGSYDIDFAIDPASIPRISFVDVLQGRVPVSAIAGKRMIVGATAVEIWDRYSVPNHGVIPGVVIQALAAETLLKGQVPATASGLWPLLLALGLVLATLRPGSRPLRMLAFGAGGLGLLALPLAGEQWLALSFPLAPALAALAAGGAAALGLHLIARFREKALVDPASGLPNHAALEADCGAEPGPVVVARIERFAAIAAGLGPGATASLIHRVADRLAFGHERRIYRIDEASLAWREPPDGAETLEDRLIALTALMRSPVDCGRLVDVALAFGIADPDLEGPGQQIAKAALAADHANRRGIRWERYVEGDSEETNWHLSLLGELDAAMAAAQVWNAYQPKLDVATGRVIGAEALVRWDHPERGAIAPDAFIPVVEEHGRARDLTLHVLDRALADALRWRAWGHDLTVAVNVSATLLLDETFVETLRKRLEANPLPPERLTIEVTETAAMDDPQRAIAALESWRELGLNISIDDYGTGQSSLGYLQKLPATELKIDMSFVRTLVSDRRNAIMVRSTIAMAHELGMKVVAEGVEDGECLALLAEMGCDVAQGWHIGKPMHAEAFEGFLNQQRQAA